MSVIVAKSATCCAGVAPPVTYNCYPAITTQRIIPVGQTLTIDGVSTSNFRASKWFVVVATASGSRVRSYELYATHRLGTNPTFSYYAILGDSISHTPQIVTAGGVMNFNIFNTDSEDIIVYVTRIPVPLTNTIVNALDVVEIGSIHTLVRAATEGTLDFVSSSTTVASKWIITLTSPTGIKSSLQIFSLTIDPSECVAYGMIGDLDPTLTFTVSSIPDFGTELTMTNAGMHDYKVDITRIPVQITSGVPYCGPTRGLALWIPTGVTVPAGTSMQVDGNIKVPDHTAAKWLVGIVDPLSGQTFAFELESTYEPISLDTFDVMYGLIGDFFDIVLTSSVVSGNLVLTAQNNTSNALAVNLLRIPVAL